MSASSSVSYVSRIAFLTSDVVLHTLPSPPEKSVFGEEFSRLSRTFTDGPVVKALPHGGDPGSSLLHQRSVALLSYVTSSSPQTLTSILPHLAELSSIPVVLHVAVQCDLTDVLLLRTSVPFFLHSSTIEQAHDNALVASRIARTEGKAVVHAFQITGSDTPADHLPADKIRAFLIAPKHSPHPNGNSHSNGYANGRANGHTNGHASGRSGDDPNDHDPSDKVSEHNSSPSPAPAPLDDPSSILNYEAYKSAALATLALVGRSVHSIRARGAADAGTVIFTLGHGLQIQKDGILALEMSLLNPILLSEILHAIPVTATRVVVLEAVYNWNVKWTPMYLEIMAAVQHRVVSQRPTVQSGVLGATTSVSPTDILKFLQQVTTSPATSRLSLGSPPSKASLAPKIPHVPAHELSYTKILSHLFPDRLEISNSPDLVPTHGPAATLPEFALGRVHAELDARNELVHSVEKLLESDRVPAELHALLSKWLLNRDDVSKSRQLGEQIIPQLISIAYLHPSVERILSLQSHFPVVSRWIIGSDAWSYDLGSSGLHHLIASGLNVNILILDTLPYSARNTGEPTRRKRDIGLYAMNHGDVFVASAAVYSSYSQVLQAILEADRYTGPSVVLAYLPYESEETTALEVLKETKLAVDAGYWPLYRWDPSKERSGREPFVLDSDIIKHELKEFLDRQNHLSQLSRPAPALAAELVGSLGASVRQARKQRAQQAYDALLGAVGGKPLLVLYASDGGNAEKKAKRLANRGKVRGLATSLAPMDTVTLQDLAKEEYVAFVTSVAGQGEAPQNGRALFKALNSAAARAESPLVGLKYSVFGMGDSHYWPRPEDAHYYNKAGKDLHARLEALGASPFAELGLGDDQDADGPETGYKLWEPLLWKALGVDAVEVTEAEPEPITNEHLKIASNFLRGTIVEGLADTSTGALAEADTQLTKFHGIYQQDDRDIREERLAEGVEAAYSFMIRVRMPGGVCDSRQWLAMDRISEEHGNGTFKITTRQTFQFHGVIKRHLKPTIQSINRALLDTLAACGDVNRNVITSATPTKSKLHRDVYEFAKNVSERLLPRTSAYHEIWLDKKLVAGDAVKDFEPLYGEFYLPRKFKIAVAVPPTNDVDVFTNDVGFIAIVDSQGKLAGFNVTAGGGMGVTHGNKKTYPRLGSVLGFCTPEQGYDVAEKIMLTQRDNGNRADRKNARLKYTIDRMGLEDFKAEVERRLGWKLPPARPYTFDRNVDDFGWAIDQDGKHNFMMFIENGRVQDEPDRNFKTGLREIAKVHKGTFRMTANQHLMIAGVAPVDLPQIKDLLAEYKLDNLNHSGLRLSSSACVAFPTCGLAMAESERYLPLLIDKVEAICEENGLRNDSIVMRMTGCPNGCARPYVAEVAFVGKAPGTYAMLLGGGYHGERLNKIYRETVSEPEILAILRPMIKHYALERLEGEHFGDFVIRAGYIAPTTEGKAWYDGMGGLGEHRDIFIAS